MGEAAEEQPQEQQQLVAEGQLLEEGLQQLRLEEVGYSLQPKERGRLQPRQLVEVAVLLRPLLEVRLAPLQPRPVAAAGAG